MSTQNENPAAAALEAVEDASNIIELLLTLAYAAWSLADNADGGSGNDNVSVDRRDFDKVSEALDALDELPDDQPGYVMEAAAKARWALRGILAAPVAAAPVGDDGRPMVLVSQEFKAQAEYDAKISSDASDLLRDNALGLTGSLPAMVGELLNLASTPAAPRIDLCNAILQLREGALHMKDPGDTVNAYNRVLALIDASPKGVHCPTCNDHGLVGGPSFYQPDEGGAPCPDCSPTGRESLHDWSQRMAKLEEGQHIGAGAHGLEDSPKGGSEALSRAYGYLWHVNHPEDIPAGHPYMSADRAAVEARKELRDMLTHEQRGEGINWVRQNLLADMQATSAEVGS